MSTGATEKLPDSGKVNSNVIAWSYDMKVHAKNCVERYFDLANKNMEQLFLVSTPCLHNHQFNEEELKTVGELSKVCTQIVLTCLYMARIGRPDIL